MRHETFEIESYLIVVTYHDNQSELLTEASQKGEPLIGTYSVKKHQPHTPDGDYHLHVYDGQNQIFAINKSGMAHDGFHGVRIPNKVYKELTNRYGGWQFPPSKIIETINYTYILRPLIDLTYKEIISETSIMQNEIEMLQSYKTISETNQVLNEHLNIDQTISQIEQVTDRLKELFTALYKRI